MKRALGGGRLQQLWGPTLYHLDDMPMDIGDVPDVFTPFKNKVGIHLHEADFRSSRLLLHVGCTSCVDGLSHHHRAFTITMLHMQVEGRSQVRPLLPTPGKGDLPLPQGGLPRLASAFEPQSVQDLNAAVPQGAPQLRTPQPPQVHTQEKLAC